MTESVAEPTTSQFVAEFLSVVSSEWTRSRYTWYVTPSVYEGLVDELTPVHRVENVGDIRYSPESMKLQTPGGVLCVEPNKRAVSELDGAIVARLSDGDAVLVSRQLGVADE